MAQLTAVQLRGEVWYQRLIPGYLLLKIWLGSRLSHVYGIYVIVHELRFPGCFDLILVGMD